MPFRRAITKKEQADMGKLKKSVRGLVVVHPMTALGREMGLKEMTGFCPTANLIPSPLRTERRCSLHSGPHLFPFSRVELVQPIAQFQSTPWQFTNPSKPHHKHRCSPQ